MIKTNVVVTSCMAYMTKKGEQASITMIVATLKYQEKDILYSIV